MIKIISDNEKELVFIFTNKIRFIVTNIGKARNTIIRMRKYKQIKR